MRPDMPRRLQVWIETQKNGLRTAPIRLADRSPDERSPAAGRDAHNHVVAIHAAKPDCPRAGDRVVFGAFDGFPQRALPARDDALDLVRRRPKGRRAFARVEHTEPAAGPGPDVEQPSALLERAHDELHGTLDVPSLLPN